MIEVDGVRFSYGGEEVLKGVSFTAEDGTIVSVLGPNGTGKTTLLRCMCGIHRQSAGTVRIDGEDVSVLRGRDLARRVGFVPQSVSVSRMSVFDSVLLGRRPYIDWAATASDIDKVSDVIDSMGLSDLSLKYVDEISGGEFQKVQIARALVQEPSVLLLDEPTSSLDVANQHMMMATVTDLVRERGVCTVVTMHDINLAVHYSDRLLFLKDGEVAAFGGPEIVTEELISGVYGIEMDVVEHRGLPLVVPRDSPKYVRGRRAF